MKKLIVSFTLTLSRKLLAFSSKLSGDTHEILTSRCVVDGSKPLIFGEPVRIICKNTLRNYQLENE